MFYILHIITNPILTTFNSKYVSLIVSRVVNSFLGGSLFRKQRTKLIISPDPESEAAGVDGVACLLPRPLRDFLLLDMALSA